MSIPPTPAAWGLLMGALAILAAAGMALLLVAGYFLEIWRDRRYRQMADELDRRTREMDALKAAVDRARADLDVGLDAPVPYLPALGPLRLDRAGADEFRRSFHAGRLT